MEEKDFLELRRRSIRLRKLISEITEPKSDPIPQIKDIASDYADGTDGVVYVHRTAWLVRLSRILDAILRKEESQSRDYESLDEIGNAVYSSVPDALAYPRSESYIKKSIFIVDILVYRFRYKRQEFIKDVTKIAFSICGVLGSEAAKKSYFKGQSLTDADSKNSVNFDNYSSSDKSSQKKFGGTIKRNEQNKEGIDKGAISQLSDSKVFLKFPNFETFENIAIIATKWQAMMVVPFNGPKENLVDLLRNNLELSQSQIISIVSLRDIRRGGFFTEYSKTEFGRSGLDRAIFTICESTRHMIHLSVASRISSYIFRADLPGDERKERGGLKKVARHLLQNKALARKLSGAGVVKRPAFRGLSLLMALSALLMSIFAVYKDWQRPLAAAHGVEVILYFAAGVLTASIVALLLWRILVTSRRRDPLYSSGLNYRAARDLLEEQRRVETLLRRLRSQVEATSIQFWSNIRQDTRMWSFATHLMRDEELGVERVEKDCINALSARIEASGDFTLDVVAYQKRQSRWMRIMLTGAVAAFVSLGVMELVLEWYSLHTGNSIYDIARVAVDARAGQGSLDDMREELSSSAQFRARSIWVLFGAISAVVIGAIIALGRRLDEDI